LKDYLTPYDDNVNKTCPNNKWNNPQYVPGIFIHTLKTKVNKYIESIKTKQ